MNEVKQMSLGKTVCQTNIKHDNVHFAQCKLGKKFFKMYKKLSGARKTW